MLKNARKAHTVAQAQNVDLARRALEEKKAAEAKRDEYKASYDQNKLATDNLRGKLEEMRKRLTAMKNKRETLVARYNAAKAQTEINKAMNGFGSDTASAGLKRMEEKMLAMEARAEASNEMSAKRNPSTKSLRTLARTKSLRMSLHDEAIREQVKRIQRSNRYIV